jgi:fatty-acyl-CoA synthase
VKLKNGAELSEQDIKDFCRGRISNFKIPRYVRFVDSFPMTVTGKIQKFRMRQVSIVELGLESAAKVETA